MKHIKLAIIALTYSIILSCGTAYVQIPIIRPAEVNMSDYKKVIIGEFRNTFDYNDRFFESKLQTEIILSNEFEVYDRKNIDIILGEKGLIIDGIIAGNENSSKKLEAATALITGTVMDQDINQKTIMIKTYEDKKGVEHKDFKTITTANAIVSFVITDLSSGKIIYASELRDEIIDEYRFTDVSTIKIDKIKILKQVKENIARLFLRKILPYREYVDVPFKTASKKFKTGIEYARNNMLDRAKEFFENETEKLIDKKELSKAYFNLGLCNMYLQNFDDAAVNFDSAEKTYHSEDYIKIHRTNNRLREEHKQVLEQSK